MNLMVISDDEQCPAVQAFVWAVADETGGKWCVIAVNPRDACALVRGATDVPIGKMTARRAIPADLDDVADLGVVTRS